MSDEAEYSSPVFDKPAFQKRCVCDKELEYTILYGSMKAFHDTSTALTNPASAVQTTQIPGD